MKEVPMIGSPPIPMAVDWPSPRSVRLSTTWYVRVPERETSPTFPSEKMLPGRMPSFASPG